MVRPTPGRAKPERFWDVPVPDLLHRLHAHLDGLTQAHASRRLRSVGRNLVAEQRRRPIAIKALRRFAEPLVAILLVAAFVTGVTGDWADTGIILVIVAVSVGLDVFQEHRAEDAVEALRARVALKARVRRGGAWREMPVEAIVPGDIVALAAGAMVPADGVVLEADDAEANEAPLTGEPYPVRKKPGPSHAATPADAFDALFAGTSLVGGEATMLVVATGGRTRIGSIAAVLATRRPTPALERGLHSLGLLILRLTVFLVLFVLLVQIAFHRPALESFLFAVALAVGLTPELLPMVTTVTLARGALRMARGKVVVKRLAAIHDLGAMEVLCTDKTGTLTEARIALTEALGSSGATPARVLELAALNAALAPGGGRSALDAAILAAAPAPAGWVAAGGLAFGFERRRASALLAEAGGPRRILVAKGAPEAVLAVCTAEEGADGTPVPLTPERRAAIAAATATRETEGLRVLAVAWREVPPGEDTTEDPAAAERDLMLAGTCAFLDPPRHSAVEAVTRFAALGVRVKVLSGDAAAVVRHLVGTLGLDGRHEVLTGDEIAEMDDHALAARVEEVDLYARLSPEQKRRVILALKARGRTVGFLGDGINDAPAIRTADVGISVEGATEVAREAADLIMLAPDLGMLADGVAEGRRTYANVMKYVRMGTSSNFGNMVSMSLASLAIPFLPLTPAQVLLNNLVYDLSETGIPFDSVEPAGLAAPHGWDMGAVLRFTLVMGPLSSVFDIATFALLLWGFGASPEEFRTAWFVESMATQILVIFLLRSAGPAWLAPPPHKALLATSLGALGLAMFLALGPFAPALGFAPMPPALLGAVVGLVVLYLAAAEILKRVAERGA